MVVLMVFILRRPLAGLLKRDFELEAPGFKARVGLDDAEEAASNALEEAVEPTPSAVVEALLSDVNDEQRANSSDETHSDEQSLLAAKIADLEGRLGIERERQAALSRVLVEGARIGWEWAKSGEDAPPKLVIDWTVDGAPHVSARRDSDADSVGMITMMAFRYEQRVRDAITGIFAGQVSIETPYRDGVADFIIRRGDRFARVIVKYSSRSATTMSTAMVGQIISMADRQIFPIVIISNYRMSSSAAQMFTDSNVGQWVLWRGERDDTALRLGIERVLMGADAAP